MIRGPQSGHGHQDWSESMAGGTGRAGQAGQPEPDGQTDTILSDRQRGLLAEEKGILERLLTRMTDFGATSEELTLLRRAVRGLDELFLLVIVGEFNSGKSAFINALLGDPVMEEGVTPTTAMINLLRFGPVHATNITPEGLVE